MNMGKIGLQRELLVYIKQNILIMFLQLRYDIDSDKSDVNINKTYIILLPATRLKSCEGGPEVHLVWWSYSIDFLVPNWRSTIHYSNRRCSSFLTCICITIGLFTNRDWLNQYRD